MNQTELRDLLNQIQVLTERARFATTELIDGYGFCNAPTPCEALAFMRSESKSTEAKQSFIWFAEYNRICTLIDIADDYIAKIQELAGGDSE